jgi:hypothetical protein
LLGLGYLLEASTLKQALYNSSIKAVHMLITEPAVLAFGLWIGFAWFVTFLFLSVSIILVDLEEVCREANCRSDTKGDVWKA